MSESEPLPEPDVPDPAELVLAAGFAAPTHEQWQKLVLGVVRKAGLVGDDASLSDAEEALETVLPDGFSVHGLYTADDGPVEAGMPGVAPFTRGRLPVRSGWDVRPLQRSADPTAAHRQVLDDLEGGASSIWLKLGGPALPVTHLATVLEGVFLDLAPVVLDAGAETASAAESFLALATARGVADADLQGVLGSDPLGLAARTGTFSGYDVLVALAGRCAASYPQVRAGVVDALPYVDAGATDGQELGMALATGTAYLRALVDGGLSLDAAAGSLEFRYAAGVDQFATIAKFRAARQIWARVCEVSGVSATCAGQRQHAVTAPGMYAALDAHTNLIRATIATFAAGVGGADAITVLPFDETLGLPDDFSRRIARNTSALLVEESHVAAVADPAGGSWAVEALTSSLAEAGWAVFQEIEAAGGMADALSSGLIDSLVATSASDRDARLSWGTEGIVGVTDFPDLHEDVDRVAPPVTEGPGLPQRRPGLIFETLRARSARAADVRPQSVTLLSVGAARGAAKTAAGVAKLLSPGGVATTRATLESAPDVIGQVVVVCPAPDADAVSLEAAAKLAGDAALTLQAADAIDLGITGLLKQVLAVLAPEEAA